MFTFKTTTTNEVQKRLTPLQREPLANVAASSNEHTNGKHSELILGLLRGDIDLAIVDLPAKAPGLRLAWHSSVHDLARFIVLPRAVDIPWLRSISAKLG